MESTAQRHLDPSARLTPEFLEDVLGAEALDWVRAQNERTEATLAEPDDGALVTDLEKRLLGVLDNPDRIPLVTVRGKHAYNFWTDGANPRGLWRRQPLEDYLAGSEAWDILLDVDSLSARENKSWVWHGASICPEDHTRALVTLSEGGSDADETREFDLVTLTFLEDGFFRPPAKGSLHWLKRDWCWLTQPSSPETTSDSGYPLQAALWHRGSRIEEAQVVLTGTREDMGVWAVTLRDRSGTRSLIEVRQDFYTGAAYLIDANPTDSKEMGPRRLPLPPTSEPAVWNEWAVVWLREDWEHLNQRHPAGSVLAMDLKSLFSDPDHAPLTVLFRPSANEVLEDLTFTRNYLVLTTIVDVVSAVTVLRPPAERDKPAGHSDGKAASSLEFGKPWSRQTLLIPSPDDVNEPASRIAETTAETGGSPRRPGASDAEEKTRRLVTASVRAVEAAEEDRLWMTVTGYTEPTSLWLVNFAEDDLDSPASPSYSLVRTAPALFNAENVTVSQHFVMSEDGTRVPYFEVRHRDATLPAPTLLYGYGGFDVSLLPAYAPTVGRAWIEEGGVYVVANIRGGGEYGPNWHRAALKQDRHHAYEDFVAVARDLVARGITTRDQLGAQGGSNGGLLMGNMYTQYPEDFAAILCQVPLLDMGRYHQLLAGSSWMAEYGDPDDPDEWAFIQNFSPLHLFADPSSQDRPHPALMITTSTKDDRVHPGHARSLGYLVEDSGKPVLYFENIEGGHAGAADNRQRAHNQALGWAFLRRVLGM